MATRRRALLKIIILGDSGWVSFNDMLRRGHLCFVKRYAA